MDGRRYTTGGVDQEDLARGDIDEGLHVGGSHAGGQHLRQSVKASMTRLLVVDDASG